MGFFSKKKKASFDDLADKSMNADLHDNLGLNEKSPFDDATVGKPGSFSDLQASQQQFLDKREMELINSKFLFKKKITYFFLKNCKRLNLNMIIQYMLAVLCQIIFISLFKHVRLLSQKLWRLSQLVTLCILIVLISVWGLFFKIDSRAF